MQLVTRARPPRGHRDLARASPRPAEQSGKATIKFGETEGRQKLFQQGLCVRISLGLDNSSLVIRTFLSSWYLEPIVPAGLSPPAFRQKGGDQTALPAPAVFQVPSAPKNPRAEVLRYQPAWG